MFKQKTAYEMRISDWSSDVCSSDLAVRNVRGGMDDDVDPAERPRRRLDQRAAVGVPRDIGGEAFGDPARLLDLRLHVLGIGNGACAQPHLGPCTRARPGAPLANAS